MGEEDVIALLRNLQGSDGGGLNRGLLGLLPALAGENTGEGSGGVASKIASATSGAGGLSGIGGGLTLLPVVTALLKIFGVGEKKSPPPLERFDLPPAIQAEAGLSRSGETFLIDRGAGDRIRPIAAPERSTAINNRRRMADFASGFDGAEPAAPLFQFQPEAARNSNTPGANITVNIQAMDSQSFLDRREDIARAVREAMLQSHSLNDVVSEL